MERATRDNMFGTPRSEDRKFRFEWANGKLQVVRNPFEEMRRWLIQARKSLLEKMSK
jgi:hypothetical protein